MYDLISENTKHDYFLCFVSLPVSAPDREQLKIELQQVNQQISQQTRGMEVCLKSPSKFTTHNAWPCLYSVILINISHAHTGCQ